METDNFKIKYLTTPIFAGAIMLATFVTYDSIQVGYDHHNIAQAISSNDQQETKLLENNLNKNSAFRNVDSAIFAGDVLFLVAAKFLIAYKFTDNSNQANLS